MRTPGTTPTRLAAFARALCGLLVALAVVAGVSDARAAGTVIIKNTQPEESDGKWKLAMSINFGSTPNLAHIPMIFQFEMTSLYERALEDKTGDKPVLFRKPLSNQQPINESMDVGFSDPTGKIFSTTKFDFVIRRDRGFEAGEYTLKIKRAGDGSPVGTPQKITLKGDNPVVDRRAIVFSGEKKKKVEEDKGSGDGDKKESGDKKDTAKNEEGGEAKSDAPSGAEVPPEEPAAPPPVPPKQGGCGCRVAGEIGSPGAAAAAAALGIALAARRRRRSQRTL